MRNQNCIRRGFTLIEFIVVAAMVTLLCAILIPVIQNARESARRGQCKERLKQIGLALHNYHTNFSNTFPPGFVVGANAVYQGWSWSVFILPYLTDSSFYSSIPFEAGLQTEYLKPGLHPHLSMFRCPSDTGRDVVSSVSVVTKPVVDWTVTPGTVRANEIFARSNYFGNAGLLLDYAGGISLDVPADPTSSDANINRGSLGTPATKYSKYHRYVDQLNFRGVFGQNSRIGIQDIKDGTGQTILVGERYSPRAAASEQPVIGDGGWLGVADPTSSAGLAMSLADVSVDAKFNVNGMPTTGFGSHHTSGNEAGAGANVVLGDGSVHFISTNINTHIYRRLSTIDDGMSTGMNHSCY